MSKVMSNRAYARLSVCRKTYSAPSDEGAAECGYDRDWMAKSAGER